MGKKKVSNKKKSVKETMEMSDEEIAKGKVRFWLGIPAMLGAFAFFVLGGVLQDKDYPWLDAVVLVGAATFTVVAFFLMVKNFFCVVFDEAVKMNREYDNQDLTQISVGAVEDVRQNFLNQKFEAQDDGWLVRRKFSFFKGSVSHCVKFTEGNDIKRILAQQVNGIDSHTQKSGSRCLIVFAYMDGVLEKAKAFVKSYGVQMIVSENAFFAHTQLSVILVAVDKQTQEGWYLDTGKKHKLSLYAYGCRLMKKCLGIVS